ncbi:MAG: hypothetical protein WC119_00025 [Synergistaceae bacterium]
MPNNIKDIMDEEGKWCRIDGCNGAMELQWPFGEECTCHLGHPPCHACINMRLTCTKCGHVIEDENYEDDEEYKGNVLTHYINL